MFRGTCNSTARDWFAGGLGGMTCQAALQLSSGCLRHGQLLSGNVPRQSFVDLYKRRSVATAGCHAQGETQLFNPGIQACRTPRSAATLQVTVEPHGLYGESILSLSLPHHAFAEAQPGPLHFASPASAANSQILVLVLRKSCHFYWP